MSVDKLPSGRFRARLMIDGARYSETFGTREEAKDWEVVTRARAINGALPKRVTVREYATRWLAGYATAPHNTRVFHETNLAHINRAVGDFAVSRVTPSDITRMLNAIIDTRSPALAERVYRTASAMFNSAEADGLCPSGSPVRAKRHRPRRQRDSHPVLERAQARSIMPNAATNSRMLRTVGTAGRHSPR
jgi:integrase